MNRIFKSLGVILVLFFLLSAVGFGYAAPLLTMSKASKDLNPDKGGCYIVGKFAMVHTKDSSYAEPSITNDAQDENAGSIFYTRIEMVNTDNNKTYAFELKPVSGSSTTYYRKEKTVTDNTNDPYWVLKVPAGTYELTNLVCSLTLRMQGYQDFRAAVIDTPVSKLVKKKISFSVQPKQIIYIGDYNTAFSTYVCLSRKDSLIYYFPRLKIDLKNNFEEAKTCFSNAADDKGKEKLGAYEFKSVLE